MVKYSKAHKELRSFQSGRGGTGQSIQVTSELKVLMRKCYEWEKDGLKYRKEDAFKMQASAKEAYHGLERENKTFLGAIRNVSNNYYILILHRCWFNQAINLIYNLSS